MATHEEGGVPRLNGAGSRHLLGALRNSGVAVFYQDHDLHYLWAENPPLGWFDTAVGGQSDREVFPEEQALIVVAAKRLALEQRRQTKAEIELSGERGLLWFELWFDPDLNANGGVAGLITTAREVTEQKRREQTLRALLREVSHRSKNLLAIIQSIAAQTGRYSDTIGEFLTRFRGRLQSLSSSQDLVTSSNWRGADLAQLVLGQVGRYCADPNRNIRLSGDNPYLNPNAALHVGLALHELAVNSVSFGALASTDGKVDIAARRVGGPEDGDMVLEWTEKTPVAPRLDSQRFGRIALEKVVPVSLGSTASLQVEDGRIVYRLTLPKESFQPEGGV